MRRLRAEAGRLQVPGHTEALSKKKFFLREIRRKASEHHSNAVLSRAGHLLRWMRTPYMAVPVGVCASSTSWGSSSSQILCITHIHLFYSAGGSIQSLTYTRKSLYHGATPPTPSVCDFICFESMYVGVLPACMSMLHVPAVPMVASRPHQISWN